MKGLNFSVFFLNKLVSSLATEVMIQREAENQKGNWIRNRKKTSSQISRLNDFRKTDPERNFTSTRTALNHFSP